MANGLLDRFQPQTIGYGNTLLEDPAQYDLSGFQAISNVMGDYGRAAIDSAMMPGRAIKGELGQPSLLNPQFTEGATQFGIDFGMLPALGTAAIASPSATTLRAGAGGVDTASGGARRGPDVDDLGFYSQALEAAKNLQQPKGTGQQFRKMLENAGVKPDEIRFTPGLEGLLSQPKVTREELVGLLEESRIRPEGTVFYGGDAQFERLSFPSDPEQLDVYQAFGGDYVADEAQYLMEDMPEDVAEAFGRFTQSATEEDVAKVQKALEERNLTALVDRDSELFVNNDDISDVIGTIEDAAETLVSERYSYDPVLRLQDPDTGYEIVGSDEMGYTIRNEGGDTLRGERFSLNEARVEAETDAIDRGIIGYGGGETRFMEYTEDGGSNYREMLLQVPEYAGKKDDFTYSGHFDEPDIVVHARTKDREFGVGENATGSALYVEEMQSDWGQQGRQQGFLKPEDTEVISQLEEKIEPIRQKMSKADSTVQSLREKAIDDIASSLGLVRGESEVRPDFYIYGNLNYPDGSKAVGAADLLQLLNGRKAAIYPNVGGYPRVDRFLNKDDLPNYYRKAVDEFDSFKDKFDPIYNQIEEIASRMQPAPFVGNSEKFAEVGIKLLISQAAKEEKKSVVFSSGDVQLGRWGEDGLETFYDKILPKVGKKVAKKLDPDAFAGVKFVEDATGDVSGDRFVIQITPKMREEALRGQPLFTVPAVPTGLLGEEKMTGDEMLRAGII